jgi:hypothetical protein
MIVSSISTVTFSSCFISCAQRTGTEHSTENLRTRSSVLPASVRKERKAEVEEKAFTVRLSFLLILVQKIYGGDERPVGTELLEVVARIETEGVQQHCREDMVGVGVPSVASNPYCVGRRTPRCIERPSVPTPERGTPGPPGQWLNQ